MILDMEFEELASEMDVEFEESLIVGGGTAENLDEELQAQHELIAQIMTELEGKAVSGAVETVKVTVLSEHEYAEAECIYHNGTELIEDSYFLSNFGSFTIEVVKNSIFYFMPHGDTFDIELLDGDVRQLEEFLIANIGFLTASTDSTLNIIERSGGLEG